MLKELLIEKGFVENLDFTLIEEVLTVLERTRVVEKEIDGVVTEVEETYLPDVPSVESLKAELVLKNDPAMLVGEYLKSQPSDENFSLNLELFLSQGEWRSSLIPAPTMNDIYSLIAPLKESKDQEAINNESQEYLNSTDWKILRHLRQLNLGITTTLSQEEFIALEQSRHEAAESIIR